MAQTYSKKDSLCILPVDEKVCRLGIPLSSVCNYCVDRCEKALDHVLGTRVVACMVWKKQAASYLRLINIDKEPWRVKINRRFRGARKSTFLGQLLGLIPLIISWKLWLHRCKALMEDTLESGKSIWLAMRFWITHIVDELLDKTTSRFNHIFFYLQLKSIDSSHSASRMVLWKKPLVGWLKPNVDSSYRGKLGICGICEII